jgi:hypothetical protein
VPRPVPPEVRARAGRRIGAVGSRPIGIRRLHGCNCSWSCCVPLLPLFLGFLGFHGHGTIASTNNA